MHRRRLTKRARAEDLKDLRSDAKDQLRSWLEEGTPQASQREPLSCAQIRSVARARGDTFTYHQSNGRGAQWEQGDPDCLWLLCLSSGHDSGYDLACTLLRDKRLYPDDPSDENERKKDSDLHEFASRCLVAIARLRSAGSGEERVDEGGYSMHITLMAGSPTGWLVEVRRNKLRHLSEGGYLVPGDWRRLIESLFESESPWVL